VGADDALVTMGLAIHGPQLSVWDACASDFRLARDLDLVASMHVSGKMLTEDGFERLSTTGLLGPHINVVHGNILGDDRLAMLVD
jgi:cytosine/adenosine deaminase-related metal-dependent hydrolase